MSRTIAADAVGDEAGERDAKLRLVREDISRGIGCVTRDDERIEQYVIAEHDDGEREQPGDSRDFCGGAL